ncbi:hypothetical protein HMPREF9058_0890 [Actinomyces sp. oral taxon 175 str. F0384]|nr:hypothetical protein HMPREF9058_0890 [Actinomyces sp. oral taxon 175 str. F0384]
MRAAAALAWARATRAETSSWRSSQVGAAADSSSGGEASSGPQSSSGASTSAQESSSKEPAAGTRAGSAASGGGVAAPPEPGMGRAPKREFIAFIVRPSLGQATDMSRFPRRTARLHSTL